MFYALGDLRPRVHETAYIHPDAVLIGDVEIGPLASVWPGAVLRGDRGRIIVGEGTNIQDNAVLHKETTIGRYCTIAHQVLAHGFVCEDHVLVANHAVVFDGCHVGEWSVIGMSALLPEGTQVPAGSLMLGVPARAAQTKTDLRELIERSSNNYLALVERYRGGLVLLAEPDRLR